MWDKLKRLLDIRISFGEKPKKKIEVSTPKKKKNTYLNSKRQPVDSKRSRKVAHDLMVKRAIQRKLTVVETPAKDGPQTAMDAMVNRATDNMLPAMDSTMPQVPNMLLQWYGFQSFIGYQMCSIVAQQWLIAKACAMPGRDAVRKGWNFTLNDGTELTDEQIDYIRQRDKDLKVSANLKEYSNFARVFGIRFVVFLVDGIDYEQPFNIDSVKPGSYRGMVQVDPYWTAPMLDMEASADPLNQSFYEPTWWHTSSPNMMNMKIHRTHVCTLIPNPVADVLKPTYFFGGVPLTQQIFERVYNAENSANEAYQLLQTKRCNVFFADLDEALANQGDLEARLAEWALLRDNYGVKVLGEEERYEQHDTSLTDLDTTILTQYELVAAIAEIPAAKLLGHAPSGSLGQLGEGEEAIYHEMLESHQTHDLTPVLDRHYALLERSELSQKWPELKDKRFIIAWPELDAMTEKERADVNYTKAQTDQILYNAGAVNSEMINTRIVSDPNSGYTGVEEVPEPPEPEGEEEGNEGGGQEEG